MSSHPFISICILSYNRPETLKRLLLTLDTKHKSALEIVICEDCSPKRDEIKQVAAEYRDNSGIPLTLILNEKNLGYDGTFNQLLKNAKGDWIVFMGDDDEFVAGAFDKMFNFLQGHQELGYVMKSHYLIHDSGKKEKFKYFPSTTYFKPGLSTYKELFRKSVFIAGFTIRRDLCLPYLTDRFDGTMLMQLYLLAEVAMKHPCAYLDEPFTQQYASYAHNANDVMFDREKNKFIPRKPTLDISLKFLDSFAMITTYMDETYSLNSTAEIKKDMSKYFYPSLAVHRANGLGLFFKYIRELNKLGFNCSIYYYIYIILLTFLGKNICDKGIFSIKQVLGRTPRL